MDTSTLLQTNNLIDINLIKSSSMSNDEIKETLVRMSETINSILLSINSKDIGLYDLNEQVSGQTYFDSSGNSSRAVFRKVIDFGSLPNAASKSVSHDLDSNWSYKFTRIYGVASDSSNKKYIPIPYASSTSTDIVELYVDSSTVVIVTGKDMTSYDTTYVVLEYCEN